MNDLSEKIEYFGSKLYASYVLPIEAYEFKSIYEDEIDGKLNLQHIAI